MSQVPAMTPMTWSMTVNQPPIRKQDWPAIINRAVNNAIDPLPGAPAHSFDPMRLWPKSGWCLDYAWTKRSELILHGYAESELLLMEVRTRDSEAHMVLNVNGMILDNLQQAIVPASKMPYTTILTQSSTNPSSWLAEED